MIFLFLLDCENLLLYEKIVSKVIDIVKDICPIGAFVKFEKGHWFSVGERATREKVGACVSFIFYELYLLTYVVALFSWVAPLF